MSQYDEVAKLNMAEELSKGQRIVEMRDLFTPGIAENGDASYRRFEIRFKAAQVTVIAAILAMIAGAVVVVVKKFKRRQQAEGAGDEDNIRSQTACLIL
jgi:hypothetical protein